MHDAPIGGDGHSALAGLVTAPLVEQVEPRPTDRHMLDRAPVVTTAVLTEHLVAIARAPKRVGRQRHAASTKCTSMPGRFP